MTVLVKKLHVLVWCLYLLVAKFSFTSGLVHELNKGSIAKFLEGKLFTLTFVDSPTCTRCHVLYPFFVAASQVFPHDPEIFFTRTHDPHLIQDWEVNELPALVYHRQGITKHEILNIDITVDDIIDEIARILHGNFGGLTRTYCVHVDEKNYDELIVTPKQSVMMLIHDKHDTDERNIMEKVAFAFRKDDAVLFAVLDVSKHKKLRDDRFLSKDTPIVMWIDSEEKSKPKRFGGVLSHVLLVMFVNERTGLNRNPDGAMHQDAGRIPEADEIIEKNIDRIIEGTSDDLKSITNALLALKENTASHHFDMLEYYTYVIDNIALAGSARIIRDMVHNLEAELFGGEDMTTKQEETYKRRKNILLHFRQLEKTYAEERKKKTREELREIMEEKRGDKKEKEVIVEADSHHIHVHEEL